MLDANQARFDRALASGRLVKAGVQVRELSWYDGWVDPEGKVLFIDLGSASEVDDYEVVLAQIARTPDGQLDLAAYEEVWVI